MTIQEYLAKTCEFIGLDETEYEIGVIEGDDRVKISLSVPEEKASQFIGGKGSNLEALQHLVRLVFKDEYQDKRIILDINQYRGEKENDLIDQAKRAAQHVLETGEEKVFRYLNSYERYLVHATVADDESLKGVATYSTDADNQRWLIICLEENAPAEATSEAEEEIVDKSDKNPSEEIQSEETQKEEVQDEDTIEE